MNTVDYIAIAVIILIVGAAAFYIIRAKKRGQKCVSCPYSKQCGEKCNCGNKKTKQDDH
ncbi:MAG: FeoB-associated Cys-rich membrane protein [Clostridia bacterium]|nr:FeoB-associated Cys-rich membrane protein [Clostridia bacterium]